MSKKISPINQKALIALCKGNKLIGDSLQLADKLFKNLKRNHTGIKYASHPMTVMSLLMEFDVTPEVYAAAALEDVLALTSLKESTLRSVAGDVVAEMVLTLTQGPDTFEAYRDRLASATPEVQTVKLASLLDHICAIPSNQLAKEYVFLGQCADLLAVLASGNAELHRRATVALHRARG